MIVKPFALVALFSILGCSATAAHVTIESRAASPGTFYKTVVQVPHGCDGAATTRLQVRMPEGFIAVKPMAKPGWTIDIVRAPYGKSYEFIHGAKLDSGVREVTWTGHLDDAFYDEFIVVGFVAGSIKPGEELVFPVRQECGDHVEQWTEVAAPGQDAHALKKPAPLVHVGPSASHEHH